MKRQKYIAYYRVSTARQGESGLGLEAQKEAVKGFLKSNDHEIIQEYTEIESGKKSNRPQLHHALAHCRKNKAVLIIAKLDRLARNVHFISGLMESGVEFVCCDNPHANRLMIHMLAAFAEHERELISKRTRDALAAAKARGVLLGKNGSVLAQKHRQEALERDEQYLPIIMELHPGKNSLRRIAAYLNSEDIAAPNGGYWYASSVRNILARNNIPTAYAR